MIFHLISLTGTLLMHSCGIEGRMLLKSTIIWMTCMHVCFVKGKLKRYLLKSVMKCN